MGVGGVEKSLINFLNNLNYNQIDVDLFLLKPEGEFFKKIPSTVNILGQIEEAQKVQIKEGLLKKIASKILKITGLYNIVKKRLLSGYKFDSSYDVVLVFHGSNNRLNFLAINNVIAKKRIMVYHNDLSVNKNDQILNYMKQFDKIYFVSKSCAESAKKLFHKIGNKIDYLYNYCNVEEVLDKSNEFEVKMPKCFNIVTATRLSNEKGVFRALKVLRKLKLQGYNFCWHLLGNGPERAKMENYVKKNNLENFVKFYGFQDNVYPYIKKANLFLLPSYQEAAPMVYAESMLLQTPVLTTNVLSANELVGEFGFICENSFQGIYNGLKTLLDDSEILNRVKQNLKNYSYNNKFIAKKINEIIK